MKNKEMLIRVRYVFEGKEQVRVFYKVGNDTWLKQSFDSVKEFYVDLQHKQGLRHLSITTEMIYQTRPMNYSHTS